MHSKNPEKKKPYATRIFKTLFWITICLFALHITLQYLNWEVYYQQNGQVYELTNRFDLDDESSVPTWFSQGLFMLIGLGALMIAHFQNAKKPKRLWRLIGVLGIIFSIDEIAGLHEFTLQTLHVIFFEDAGPTEVDNAWLIVLPFVLIAGIWILWNLYKYVPKRTLILIGVAGMVFLSGAIGVDLLTSITERESFLNQGLLTGLEEILELLSISVIIYALADHIERFHKSQVETIIKAISSTKA